jgi:hypothetical protein
LCSHPRGSESPPQVRAQALFQLTRRELLAKLFSGLPVSFLLLPEIRVDLIAVTKVIRDDVVHIGQGERRELIDDVLGRGAVLKGPQHGFQRHTAPTDAERAVGFAKRWGFGKKLDRHEVYYTRPVGPGGTSAEHFCTVATLTPFVRVVAACLAKPVEPLQEREPSRSAALMT